MLCVKGMYVPTKSVNIVGKYVRQNKQGLTPWTSKKCNLKLLAITCIEAMTKQEHKSVQVFLKFAQCMQKFNFSLQTNR